MSYDDTAAQGGHDATQSTSATPEEIAQITSAEQIDDRSRSWFEPDYDGVPDDTSWADLGPVV